MKFGILGARGVLGSDIADLLKVRGHEVVEIDRENYESHRGQKFEVLINANGNSRRFWGNQNPIEDFDASTASVYRSLRDFAYDSYVYISSADVYPNHQSPDGSKEDSIIDPQKLSPYGLHKFLAERLVMYWAKDHIILRSSMILGSSLKKGAIYDILQKSPLFASQDSYLQMISAEAIGEIILQILSGKERGIWNVGGAGSFALKDASHFFGFEPSYNAEAEIQAYETNIEKVQKVYPLKKSTEYLAEFVKNYEK